jgi:hypothetical protein
MGANQATILKRLEHFGNADTTHPEHVGQELMREQEFIGHGPIVRHQNPAATSLLHLVQAIAGNALRNLFHECHVVPIQQAPERTISGSLGLKIFWV